MKSDFNRNFKSEFLVFIKKTPTELIIGCLLGAGPVITNSKTPEALNKTLESLLAGAHLINYAFYLIVLDWVLAFLSTRHYKTDRAKAIIHYFYGISSEVGSTFITILRTGSGAILGFMTISTFSSFNEISRADYISGAVEAFFIFMMTIFIAFIHYQFKPKHFKSHYKNNLILSIRT